MDKLEATQVLEALDRAVGMDEMDQKDVMHEIKQAWARMPPAQCKLLQSRAKILKDSGVNFGDQGAVELYAKLGMFLKSRGV